MKQLKDGGKAFYAGVWNKALMMGLSLLALLALVGLGFSLGTAADVEEARIIQALIGVFLLLEGFSLYQCVILFRPVCVVYPQKICARKKEMYWQEINLYSVAPAREKTLLLVGVDKGRANSLKIAFGSLCGQDQKLLEQELIARGVPDQQHYLDDIQTELKKLTDALNQINK